MWKHNACPIYCPKFSRESLIAVLLAVSLCACSTRMDRKNLNSTEAEETETQVLDEVSEDEV